MRSETTTETERSWRAKVDAVAAWVAEHGRMPRRRADDPQEVVYGELLSRWSRAARGETKAGTWSQERTDHLSATLPQWTPGATNDDIWDARLLGLQAWIQARGGARPSTASTDDVERALGRFVGNSRVARAGRGNTRWDAHREAAMDAVLPGWQQPGHKTRSIR